MKIKTQLQRGFTLMELMIAVAVIAILSAIALPLYTNYVTDTQDMVLVSNLRTIEVFQEDFRMRTGNYFVGPGDLAAITAAIDWEPEGDQPGTTYAIADGGGGNTYEVTATAPDGTSVCLEFPGGTLC